MKHSAHEETSTERVERYVKDYRPRDLASMLVALEKQNQRLRNEISRLKRQKTEVQP